MKRNHPAWILRAVHQLDDWRIDVRGFDELEACERAAERLRAGGYEVYIDPYKPEDAWMFRKH